MTLLSKRLITPKAVVGDVHGSISQLETLVDHLRPYHRPIIFLGDYVNRGVDSRQVLEFLLKLQAGNDGHDFLCGNHDWAFLEFIDFNRFDQFALLGGLQTLASYLPAGTRGDVHTALLDTIPKSHIEFLRTLKPFFEDDDVICSHTGISLTKPEDRSLAQMALTSHPELLVAPSCGPKLVICGHYPQVSLQPLQRRGLICLDTGCGTLPEGKLSALLLPEEEVLQVNKSGQVGRITPS
jgi:serine/threonine protein phosphatase 1